MKTGVWLIGIVLAIGLLPAAFASGGKLKQAVKADNRDAFTAVAATVRQDMQPGGRYEFVDSKEREDVNVHLNDMQGLLDKYGTVAQMDQDAKTRLFNDQEAVNGVLTRRDDQRLVCENTAPLGSHIPRTTCQTYREMVMKQRGTQDYLYKARQVAQPVAGH